MAEVRGTWKGNMAFDLGIEMATIPSDADPQFGGKGYGPRPKALMLTALAGCTGMDVVSILGKMKVEFDAFDIRIKAEAADQHPKVYRKVHIDYRFRGKDLPMDKLERAVNLSLDQYCAVAATIKQTAELSYKIIMD